MKILADENIHTGIINGLRNAGFETLFVPEAGLAGCDDEKILEYSERHDLILLRYRLINTDRIAKNIAEVINNEKELFNIEKSFVIVLSEAGYRIHRHQK